eukprot:515619-Pelagomonas_calceolata.AAC.2
MPVVELSVEAVAVDAELLATIHQLQVTLLQSCTQRCCVVTAVEEAQAVCCLAQVLFAAPLGQMLVAVGAAG